MKENTMHGSYLRFFLMVGTFIRAQREEIATMKTLIGELEQQEGR